MIDDGTAPFWRATLALCLGSFMIFANVYLTQPLLPTFVQTFQITELQAGWSFTITTLTLGISLLFYGPLSDAYGRKSLMLMSMTGVVLTTFMLSQTQSYSMLLFWRGLQGLCLGGLPAIAIAYMSDEFKHKAMILAVGFYISGNTIGGIGGRLIGGFVGEWLGWSETFLVMTLVSFILLMLFAMLLPASQHFVAKKVTPVAMLVQLARHLQNPLLLLAYLIGGFNFFIFINQYSFVTFLLADAPYNLSPSWLGLLFLTYLSGTVGSALSGRIAQRIPQPVCMIIGILILMAGSLVTLIPSIWGIIGGFLISAFGFFFAHSTASSWVSHNAHQAKASASSLYLLFYYLGASSGGFYLQPFWEWAGWSGIVAGSLLVLMLTLVTALVLYRISAANNVSVSMH
ncbi:MFS transporter [Neptunomonas qingdaonensis]|uniref:MFS transporter, YNFM family, putative membrane transport protein n=1 Tax=Neptunomonas qingdaonensis TaxID=1045558 RepID=A0A1I2M3N0_9GAMM|nr:MFS transporter [Neptunomonas qingdaonensis]SFF86122.1 MFS transporter, YNFM family, putative membrane transport protein [Neptunomonas qingdaonensis]